jgi:1,4-alpha-glucan branching enzyme
MEKRIEGQTDNKRKGTRKASKRPAKESGSAGIKKQYFKSSPTCRVTFTLPKEAAAEAQSVALVGDFNNWDREAAPMKRLKDGSFSITLELQRDREYRFRYLIDDSRWENDWHADRYEKNRYGDDDSVVVV